ncbi:glycoside hydrolase domain-containing protein [Kitasatospora aureofaciens]|uniref:glycoside hydrolase domain-containing protein n=1 Tax=Kitasatospora aureofaciens TaxID=1894 RepID=UPI0033EB5177
MALGLDIAWDRPSTNDILATGAHFVARYLSPDSSKNLNSTEVRDYPANGLSIVVVWESTAGRMLAGYSAGVSDAQAAEAQRRSLGLPNDMVIYFACDTDVSGSQYHTVNEYMRGVNSVIGLNRTGFYGGYYEVENVAAAPATASYFWQTTAWSNGHWSAHANIRQDGGTLLGGAADVDHSMTDDFGQYPRPQAAVEEDPLPFSEDDIRRFIREECSGQQVRDMHAYAVFWFLTAALSGNFPSGLDADWQTFMQITHDKLSADGVAAAVWNYGLTNPFNPDSNGQPQVQPALDFQVDQDHKFNMTKAALDALAAQLGQVHGVDTATVVAAVQDAIAKASVHVDVTVQNSATAPKGA